MNPIIVAWLIGKLALSFEPRGYLPDDRSNNRASRDFARQIILTARGTGRRSRAAYRVRAYYLCRKSMAAA